VQPSRKTRRARKAKAAKTYNMRGEDAFVIAEAYRAITLGQSAKAVQLALQVSKTNPENIHPWLVLGAVALERRETEPARAFFAQAVSIAPKDAGALTGLGKAHFLAADAFKAVEHFQSAIAAGSNDAGMARIYADLISRLKRFSVGAKYLGIMASRLVDADLWFKCGEMHLGAEGFSGAADAFTHAFEIDPQTKEHRVAHAKSLIFRHEYHEADAWLDKIMCEFPENDELPTLKMIVSRNLGRWDDAISHLDFEYQKPVHYQRALTQIAYTHMDRGELDQAEGCLREAVCVDNEGQYIARKSLGTLLFLRGKFKAGLPFYDARNLTLSGNPVSVEHVIQGDFLDSARIYMRAEQGVGDQFALLPLVGKIGIGAGRTISTFVGEKRMETILKNSNLPFEFCPEQEFEAIAGDLDPKQVCFLGDLIRLAVQNNGLQGNLGGYIQVPPEKIEHLKNRYVRMSEGRPLFGLAWQSRESLTGYHRSIPLAQMVNALPIDAFVVNLQYGDCRGEIEQAKNIRKDVTIWQDRKVDQMADLMSFLAQISALEAIVTIDNTTAHACGAIGHKQAHVLLPTGAECMWYWGTSGKTDPWYGSLNLHRQSVAQDWTQPLRGLRLLFS
jgi:Flp pilus assembly protein TadD